MRLWIAFIFIIILLCLNILLSTESQLPESIESSDEARDSCGTLDFIIKELQNDSFPFIAHFPNSTRSHSPLPWSNFGRRIFTFEAILANVATSDKWILLATFESKYHHWVSNWLTFVALNNRYENTLIIASRHHECEPLWNQGLICFAHEDLFYSTINPLDARAYNMTLATQLKWYYSRWILQLGYQVLFSDVDIVFLQDPFLLLNQTKYWDVLGLSDFCRPLFRKTLNQIPTGCFLYKRSEPCQSTGLMAYRQTPASIQFLKHVWDEMLRTLQWEQAIANYVLVEHIAHHKLIHQFIDDRYAANCPVIKQLAYVVPFQSLINHLIALHVGYINDKEEKMQAFQSIGLWHSDPNYQYRLLPPGLNNVTNVMDLIPETIPLNWCVTDCHFCCPPLCIW